MDRKDEIANRYFEWIYELVCRNRYAKQISFRKLLMYLHSTEFTYFVPNDDNRAEDGIDLRDRFILSNGYEDGCNYLDGPCSILEMMVALAIRCEESIMDDPGFGDRTNQWFWGMIVSLGLGSMTDDRFDKGYVADAVERFLNREYAPNGKGGLFTIRNCTRDLRTIEIWYQMCWYLDTIA